MNIDLGIFNISPVKLTGDICVKQLTNESFVRVSNNTISWDAISLEGYRIGDPDLSSAMSEVKNNKLAAGAMVANLFGTGVSTNFYVPVIKLTTPTQGTVLAFRGEAYAYSAESDYCLRVVTLTENGRKRRIVKGGGPRSAVLNKGLKLCTESEVPYLDTDCFQSAVFSKVVVKTTEAGADEALNYAGDFVAYPKEGKTIFLNVTKEEFDKKISFYSKEDRKCMAKQLKRLTCIDMDTNLSMLNLKTVVNSTVKRDGMIGAVSVSTFLKWIRSLEEKEVISPRFAKKLTRKAAGKVFVARCIVDTRFAKGTIEVSPLVADDAITLYGYQSFVKEIKINAGNCLYFKLGNEGKEASYGESVAHNLVGGRELLNELLTNRCQEVEGNTKNFDMDLVKGSNEAMAKMAKLATNDITASSLEEVTSKIVNALGLAQYKKTACKSLSKSVRGLKVKVPGSSYGKLLVPVKGCSYLGKSKRPLVLRNKFIGPKEAPIGNASDAYEFLGTIKHEVARIVVSNAAIYTSVKDAPHLCFVAGGADLDGDTLGIIYTGVDKKLSIQHGVPVHNAVAYRFPIGHREVQCVKVMNTDRRDVKYYDIAPRYSDPKGTIDDVASDEKDVMPQLLPVKLNSQEVLMSVPGVELIGYFTTLLNACQRSMEYMVNEGLDTSKLKELAIWRIPSSDVVDCSRGGDETLIDRVSDAMDEVKQASLFVPRVYGHHYDSMLTGESYLQGATVVKGDGVSKTIEALNAEVVRINNASTDLVARSIKPIRGLFKESKKDYPAGRFIARMWGDLWQSLMSLAECQESSLMAEELQNRLSNTVYTVMNKSLETLRGYSDELYRGTCYGVLINFLEKYGKPVMDGDVQATNEQGELIVSKGAEGILFSEDILNELATILTDMLDGTGRPSKHHGLVGTSGGHENSHEELNMDTVRTTLADPVKAGKLVSVSYRYLDEDSEMDRNLSNMKGDSSRITSSLNVGRVGMFTLRGGK